MPSSQPVTADVLIVTVSRVESLALLQAFKQATGNEAKTVSIGDRVYRDLGEINGVKVFMALSEMGAGGLGAAQQAVKKGIAALKPHAVIMVGIAFGVNENKQSIGDVLVSRQLMLYEAQRVGVGEIVPLSRGDKPHAAPRLVNYLQSAHLGWDEAEVRFGLVLTGEKLVDELDYRESLKKLEPEAIGGEMEGAGLYVECQDAKVDWILVKAICDWADGNKDQDKVARQQKAAQNATAFVVHALQHATLERLQSQSEFAPPVTHHAKTHEELAPSPNAHKLFPVPPTMTRRFIGREEKCTEVIAAIKEHRLVTIKGVGGVGKSALAREVLESSEIRQRFGGLIAWIGLDIVTIDAKDAVTAAIVEQLQLDRKAKGHAFSDEDVESPVDRLVRSLAGVPALLVLDSCDGVVNGVSELCAELQVLATELSVLATSWKPLSISGEKVIQLDPMCVPGEIVSTDDFIKSEAVRLFEQYAQLRNADFSVTDRNRQPISNILELTEGLPLAIRLTAVRVANTPLDQIVQQLRTNLLLRADTKIISPIPRHASLSLCFDWSFGLLSDDAKALFPLLSLFIAPFTYDHAIRLAQGTDHTPGTLSSIRAENARSELVDASFIEFDITNERHWMLGLLRAYGYEKLTQFRSLKQARTQFADCFSEFNGDNPVLQLPLEEPYDKENLCQAGWYALDEKLTSAASRLRLTIDRWLKETGQWSERRIFNQRLVALLKKYHKEELARSWAHTGLAESLNELGEPIDVVINEYLQALKYIPKQWPKSAKEAQNRDRIEKTVVEGLSEQYARKGEMGKAFGIVNDMLQHERYLTDHKFRASLHDQLGRLYLDTPQWGPAIEQFKESLRLREDYTTDEEHDRHLQDKEQARSWLNLGDAYLKSHEHGQAINAYEKAATLWENTRTWHDANVALSKQAKTLSIAGKAPQAEEIFLRVIERRKANKDIRGAALSEAEFAAHYNRMDDLDRAEQHIESACAKLEELREFRNLAHSLETAADIFIRKRKWPEAKQSLRKSLCLREKLGDRGQVITLDRLGRLYDALGDTPNACKYFAESIKRARLIERPIELARVLLNGAIMKARHGPFEEAEKLLAEAILIFKALERRDDASDACYLLQWITELRTKSGTDWTNDEYRTAQRAIRGLGERMRAAESWEAVADEYGLMIDEFARMPIQAAIARNEMGAALRHVPDGIDRAQACHDQSLQFFQDVQQEAGIADSLHKLGKVWLERVKQIGRVGDRQSKQVLQQAIQFYEQSITANRSMGNPVGEVLSLEGLAEAKEMDGDIEQSFSALMEARNAVQIRPTSATAQQNAECVEGFLARHPEFRNRVD